MCGWINDFNSTIPWRRHSGPTASLNTGPKCDFTNCANGSYIYMEASGIQPGDQARLLSPVLKGPGERCLSFLYHMYGAQTGSLEATLVSVNSTDQTLWNATGDQGDAWKQMAIDFVAFHDFQIVLEATRGDGFRGDIAVDNLKLTSRKCLAAISCTFEQGFCDLVNDASNDTFDWSLTKGATVTPSTGPANDHTTGTGQFAYIEASLPQVSGDRARLLTPELYGSKAGYCLKLWYFMYGRDVATLSLSLKHGAGERLLWRETGNQGEQWLQKKIQIPPTNFRFKITIDAVVGATYASDIAIDDFQLDEGQC